MQWIVVEQQESAHFGDLRELDGVRHARVAPTELRRILVFRVLRVVEEEVGADGELESRDPAPVTLVDRPAERRLVICR